MFSFLAKQSICVYDILMQSRASAEMIRRCRQGSEKLRKNML